METFIKVCFIVIALNLLVVLTTINAVLVFLAYKLKVVEFIMNAF